jgi:GH25 family lysozyme M1 (1,4-beta-N-acetylmuramidase)
MTNAQGLDVSRWQGSFDWRGHPGISFAGAKAYEAGAGEDPEFAANWRDMWQAFGGKLARISYAFFHPADSVAAQAATLVQLTRDHGLQLGDHFACDGEVTDGLPADEVVRACREFSHLVNKAAPEHRCLAYTFRDFPAPWGTWPLWLAAPGTTDPVVPAPWKRWWIVQYQQTGLDLDEFCGPEDALLSFMRMPADRR